MEKNKDGFVGGALALTLSALMVKVLGVIYKIPLSYILGDEGMGYFNSAYSVYGFFYIIASAGVPKAIAMLVTEAEQSRGADLSHTIYKKSLKLFAVFGAVITICFVLLCDPLSKLVGNSNSYATMLAIAPSIFFIALSGVTRGYLNGRESFLPIAISQLIEAIAKLVFGILFAYLGMTLSFSLPLISSFTVFGITLGSFFSSLYLYISAFSCEKGNKKGQSINIPSKLLAGKIVKIALPITLSSSILSITNIIDLGITMRALEGLGYGESEASALYGNYTTLAVPMFNLVVSVLTPISVTCLPRLVSAKLNDNWNEFNKILSGALVLTATAAAPCTMMLFLYPFNILDMLFSSQASVGGFELLSALSFAAFIVPILTVFNTALESAGKIKLSVCSLLVGALVKLVFSWLLINNEDIGMLGAPIGTVVSYSVSLAVSLICLRSLSSARVEWSALLRPIIVSAVAYIPIFLLIFSNGLLGSGDPATIVSVLVSTILYVVMEFSTIFEWCLAVKNGKNEQKTQKSIIK